METLIELIIRISIGSAIFYAFYALLLRKTTFFRLNRLYLLAAIVLPVLFAIFPLQYTVWVEGRAPMQTEVWNDLLGQGAPIPNDQPLANESNFNWSSVLLAIYSTGLILLALRLLLQSIKPIQLILTNSKNKNGHYPIVENRHFSVPFSFFNHIFIHPEYHKQEDLPIILAHEEVHIRERHWIDLLVIELFTLVFWFNPISWLLEQAIKQNHEYLADQGVLSRGQSPARYQLLLVNQLMGMQVLGLSNNLNFALGPTRLNMMKKQKTSPKQLLRLGLLLPVVAGLLFAFAKPEYKTTASTPLQTESGITTVTTTTEKTEISGIVLDQNGAPLPGTSIVMKGSTLGTVADRDGKFKLNVPNDSEVALVASFVGYKTESNELKAELETNRFELNFTLEKAVIFVSTELDEDDIPPPPAPPVPVAIDAPDSPNSPVNSEDEVFIVVEEMPHYPGGHYALAKYINEEQSKFKVGYPIGGSAPDYGPTTVKFTVSANGKVGQVVVRKSSGVKALDDQAVKIVKGMEDWTPGKQRGKAVPVDYALQIKF